MRVGVASRVFSSFRSFMDASVKDSRKELKDPMKIYSLIDVKGNLTTDSELTEDSVIHDGTRKKSSFKQNLLI